MCDCDVTNNMIISSYETEIGIISDHSPKSIHGGHE